MSEKVKCPWCGQIQELGDRGCWACGGPLDFSPQQVKRELRKLPSIIELPHHTFSNQNVPRIDYFQIVVQPGEKFIKSLYRGGILDSIMFVHDSRNLVDARIVVNHSFWVFSLPLEVDILTVPISINTDAQLDLELELVSRDNEICVVRVYVKRTIFTR